MSTVYKAAEHSNQTQQAESQAQHDHMEVHHEKKRAAIELVNDVVRRVGEVKRKAAYGAYVVCPGKRFRDEQMDEEVVLLLRAHPVTQIRWVLGTVLILVLPQLVLLTGMFGLVPDRFIFLAHLGVYLVAFGYAFENFLHWYYSVLIVTNERLVDIDFNGLLNRSIAYAALNDIQQPSLNAGGLLQSIFHYGNVDVATAAEKVEVEILNVPYPDKVLRIISELSEELEKRRERGE